MHQRQADVVQAVEQAVLAVRRDVEGERETGRRRHRLRGQIDVERVTFARFALLEQAVDDLRRGNNRQDAVLVAVGEEDVGE